MNIDTAITTLSYKFPLQIIKIIFLLHIIENMTRMFYKLPNLTLGVHLFWFFYQNKCPSFAFIILLEIFFLSINCTQSFPSE